MARGGYRCEENDKIVPAQCFQHGPSNISAHANDDAHDTSEGNRHRHDLFVFRLLVELRAAIVNPVPVRHDDVCGESDRPRL